MIKFVNKNQLVKFISNLPEHVDFERLLMEDFGKLPGEYDPSWLWKYFTRKDFLNEDPFPIDETYDVFQMDENAEIETHININPNKKGMRIKNIGNLEGKCIIRFNPHIKKFEGLVGETLISSSKSKDFVISRLDAFGFKEFEELN